MKSLGTPTWFAGFVLLFTAGASADNISFATASSLMIGQTPVTAVINTTTPERWYRFLPNVSGRSYCVETATAPDETASLDTRVTVFRSDGTTVLIQAEFAPNEPFNNAVGDRACFINETVNEVLRIRVDSRPGFGGPSASPRGFTMRVLETTLFSNWFFLGGDYGAFTILRNTTNTSVSYTVNWRSAAGAIVGTTSGALAGNAGTFFNARDFPGAVAAGSGTVDIAHNSSPEGIAASTTVLSVTTGLSFDAPFIRRQPW